MREKNNIIFNQIEKLKNLYLTQIEYVKLLALLGKNVY